MAASSCPPDTNRRTIVGAALAAPIILLPPASSTGLGLEEMTGYLRMLGDALSIPGDLLSPLAAKVAHQIDPVELERIVSAAFTRLMQGIGPVAASAGATVPALVDDDYAAGRFVLVHGVSFAHTELALLYPLTQSRR